MHLENRYRFNMKKYPLIYRKFHTKKGWSSTWVLPITKSPKIYAGLKARSFLKVHLKVEYGKKKDVFGKLVMFENSGTYDNKKEARLALRAFLER